MKIEPKVVKSIRERNGDIGVFFSLGDKLFLIEERVLNEPNSNKYDTVNQLFYDSKEEAQQAFDNLIDAFKRDYHELEAAAKNGNYANHGSESLYIVNLNSQPVLIV